MCTRCGRTWVTAAVEAAVEPGCGYQEKDEEEEGREKERIWIARGASWSVLHNQQSDLSTVPAITHPLRL